MMENHLTSYQSVITEIKSIISSGQEAVYSASSKAMLLTYWNNYYIKFYQCFPDEQIDMYVRMYDDLKRGQGDNP
ncbi:MAG TPA: hypothetical protein H9766_04705, partial [Candidatus Dorea faecigallinarum]|nr:hypothetical protein [Candidatus Dorea faecigallinarum]